MNFNALFQMIGYDDLGAGAYLVEANIIDNLGQFSAMDVAPGFYVFCNGVDFGRPLVIPYLIDNVVSVDGAKVRVNMTYVGTDVNGPFSPDGESIIVDRTTSGSFDIPDPGTYLLSTVFCNAVRNYEIQSLSSDAMYKSVYDPDKDAVLESQNIGLIDCGTF